MITSMRFASITVTDIDEALAFYRDTLGFRIVRETPLPGGNRFVMAEPPAGGTALVFSMPMPGQEHVPSRSIAFGADEVQPTYEALVAKGVSFPRPPAATPWGGVEAAFADPFGNTFMLQEGGF